MAGLRTYRTKRRFGVTAEPKGRVGGKSGHAFVIQKHDATRLHYDLRLELDGVMKSWAVTRGPSLVPGDKRLAVQVEDHPIDYNKFEGTIPKGEYGGGTVMVWDRGTWQPEQDPHKGLKKGHLSFTLDGEKLHGAWHLVRMHRRPGEKRDNWLLIKSEDDAARRPRDGDVLEQEPLSVKTGRNLDEIAGRTAKPTKTRSKKTATTGTKNKAKTAAKKTKKTIKSKRNQKTSVAKRAVRKRTQAAVIKPLRRMAEVESDDGPLSLAGARRAALPDFVEPALTTLAAKAPDSANWIHEIKFDGYRLQARVDDGRVKLLTRTGLDWTRKFSSVAAAVAKLPAGRALVDGEVTVDGDNGISSFSLLQKDLSAGRQDRMRFYVFDLMHLDGKDLRSLPLHARKEALATLLDRSQDDASDNPLRLSESIVENGSTVLKHACKMGLEGIISKRNDAPYRSGRRHDWIKTKCIDRQEFVIAGFVPSAADASAVGALVLGIYDGDKLKYAGRTGTGFTHVSAREIFKKLKKLRRDKTPFPAVPAEERGARGPIWVEPKLVAEVDFHG